MLLTEVVYMLFTEIRESRYQNDCTEDRQVDNKQLSISNHHKVRTT